MLDVITADPLNAETPWELLAEPVTPTASFFKRNHEPFPQGPDHLELCGQSLSLAQLQELGSQEVEMTFECAGNARTRFSPLPPGTPWGIKAMSNARWTGIPLSRALERAPFPTGTLELVFEGVDGVGDRVYARSLTPADLGDAWLVWGMNGQPLSPQHGGPLRLMVGGWYGMASVKWLRRIYAVNEPFRGYYQTEDYQFLPPDGPSRPVTRMLPKAFIVTPRPGSSEGSSVTVRGWAWTGSGAITGVEVLVDGACHESQLDPERGPYAWRGFSLELQLSAGSHQLRALARDSSGRTQPLEAPWNQQGYENNSALPVDFEVA